MTSNNPIPIIIAFLISLSIHETAHAYIANRLGDPTARLAGRVTLNPFAHLDPVGTLLPLFLMMMGSPIIFGWGKPVPFDPFNLLHPRRDAALISFAGPASNLILAVALSVIFRLIYPFLIPYSLIISLFVSMIALNVMWGLFNLIPIHPLDGGKVLVGLLPREHAYKIDKVLKQYGFIILIFLIFPFLGTSPVIFILSPIINFILNILLPRVPLV